ncbi:hypothetical protein GGX14DRAFT_663464 [Mycena pura]|uniref:Uncharacterized protein n=1 Tax=Mycena pura TaxID=153505 RepID=A0AAD7E036_9AGAR|nr:hypothetical protein GGX14DRAFT_663464 [Mycena pura]
MAQPQSLHSDIRENDITHLKLSDLPEPQRKLVVRPPNADPDVETPEYMWMIPESDDPRLPFKEDIMVRQEYHNVLVAILSSLYRQSQVAPQKKEFPPTQDEQMNVDSAEEPKIPLCIPNDLPDISKEATLPNPFKDPLHGHFYRRNSALIITGFPGIGKTLLLSVIFRLRVAAGLPTAFMRSADCILVYTDKQLFELANPGQIPLAVPKGAWILLDSKYSFFIPPERVVRSGLFIVEAASPRLGHMAWAGKIRGPYQFCVMEPWTLEELFTASSLQSRSCSGNDIQAFFNKFGGSAWHVYRDSSDLSSFELLVDTAARCLNRELIHRLMTSPSPTVAPSPSTAAVNDRVGHMLITALPFDDKDRTQFRNVPPTTHLEKKLLRRINNNTMIARREIYIINVGVPGAPGCKATATDLLDKHHHGFIGLGGKWRLRQFTQTKGAHSNSKTNGWEVSKEDSDVFLLADGKMIISRSKGRTRAGKAPAATKFKGLTMVNFPSDNLQELHLHHYYRPSDSNFLTFDSFYMDKKGHCITFQVTKSDKEHSVKDGGREWLEERGITKFTYILVSGPKMGDPPSLSVPRDQENKFDFFYHLVLEYRELKELLSPSDSDSD